MRIAGRFNGPPGSGNGGVTCGRLAAYVGAPAVEVTLRRPPPLDRDLRVDASEGSARLLDGEVLVAEAVPSTVDLDVPDAVTVEVARTAEQAYAGPSEHPFATCFVCGTDRTDGLGLRPGPTAGGTACTCVPESDDPVMVWAALDCPAGWTVLKPGRPLVLGRMALTAPGTVAPGQVHVVQGWITGQDGRKVHTGSVLRDPDGGVVAVARGTWFEIDPATFGT